MPSRRHFLHGCGAALALHQGLPAVSAATADAAEEAGRFEVYDSFPSRHLSSRRVVWLPPDYEAGGERHAVLYMHDGQNLFDPATAMAGQPWGVDAHLLALRRAGAIRPTLVVGIWNTPQRWREYVPAAALTALPAELRGRLSRAGASEGLAEPLSEAYLRFIVMELKPAIDARFRTRRGPADTSLMGSSMGGLISLYGLARYPAVFGAAACLSTHWPLATDPTLLAQTSQVDEAAAAYRDWLRQHLPPAGAHRLYFDHGDQQLDAHYARYQEQMSPLLAAKGYREGRDLQVRAFPGATHNEQAWRARLGIPLDFLLRE